MSRSPNQNSVAKRRNRTLLDMLSSILCNSKLPKSLWTEALKIAAYIYILNWVPTKAIPKTPFELFKGWKVSLQHILIWGCTFKVRIYNPQERKLEPRTISRYFIKYAENPRDIDFTIHLTTIGLWNQEMKIFLRMTWLVEWSISGFSFF